VHYALSFSFLGSIAHELLVKGQLERIFRHREKVVAELFGG
jgi:hypothetical protein